MDKHRTSVCIAGVVTAAFNPDGADEIVIALREAARLGFKRIVIPHEIEGNSGQYVEEAIATVMHDFENAHIVIQKVPVDCGETALRWRSGVNAAFEDPSVECAFVMPSDFSTEVSEELRAGLQKMVLLAERKRLVIGDFLASPGFKEWFDSGVGFPAVAALYPDQSEKLLQSGQRKLRSEWFILGRDVLERTKRDLLLWDMDPTVSLVLATDRADDLTLEIVDLGYFSDNPKTRRPLGQLLQITRFVGQLAVNAIRLEISKGFSDLEQLQRYDELRSRLDAAFRSCLEGIDVNRRELTSEPTPYQRNFCTNNKTIVSFKMEWRDFRGFSVIGDPVEADLIEGPPSVLTLRNVTGSNALYDALNRLMYGPLGDALKEEFVFAKLPFESYHVTLQDGINIDNVHHLRPKAATDFQNFFVTLPESAAHPAARLPPPVRLDNPACFQFDRLSIWNRSVLVARIRPADEQTRLVVSELERYRQRLSSEWEEAFGLPVPATSCWTPHISLGYFPCRDIVPFVEPRLARWSDEFAEKIGTARCGFRSFSPYAFVDMVTFIKMKQIL